MTNKLIHSFYSKRCGQDWLFVHSCYFYLSALYAKESGFDITLYTDSDFKEIMEAAPYNGTVIVLDNHDEYAKIDPQFWAWPKFIALDMVPRDTIHIDGDVFLKDGFDKSLLNTDNCDAICQCLEHCIKKTTIDSYQASFNTIKHIDFPSFIEKKVPVCMPNNGVMCIKNEKLWEEYRDTYWDMLKQCPNGSLKPEGWSVPDIIFEQHFLKEICDERGYNIKYILNGITEEELTLDAVAKHYQHVCTDKRIKIAQCLKLIKKKSKICYETLKFYWKDIFPMYFEEKNDIFS